MISLMQRVTEASVTINGKRTAEISMGALALIGIEKQDSRKTADQLAERMLHYRMFSDQQGKMNQDIRAVDGQLLLVPQFTLVADTRKGRRPGFSTAATPDQASNLFDHLVSTLSSLYASVKCGTFGADMQVGLINDGPVTFWIRVDPSV